TARADVTYHGSFNELAWGANGMLYALAVERGRRHNGFRYGVIAFTADGRAVWEYSQYEPVNAMAVFGEGRVAITDAARAVKMLSADGTPLWSAATEATASVCAGDTGGVLYACDWHGNVLAFAADSGKLRCKTNVTANVWRDDIERLPAQPYAGRSYGIHTRRPAEQPMAGENIAPQAKATAGGLPGWFGTGRVQIQPAVLTDGKLNDLDQPWLAVIECHKAGNNARYVWAEFEWQDDVQVSGVAVHEDERHPESWPWEVCVQVWRDGRWQDTAVSLLTPGPWHNVSLPQPVSTRKIRYCVTGVLMNNVRTDGIRVVR
ncbi:MAG TPA: PQQ-binding-like beta-propeller repeat protein, partial [Vicinamibacterales bacterium]|nr:PQQ-binding-like beta-propeller repeat protein [Vicinamibacterales bacterium]